MRMDAISVSVRRALWPLTALLILSPHVSGDSMFSPERAVTKIEDGIYVIRHKDPFPGWVNGNTTVIIGKREVLVVDSCQIASDAREDIAQIRQWTDKPVRYLLNTHWHLDHTGGNQEYVKAFPGLAIIAQEQTRAMMDSTNPVLVTQTLEGATSTETRIAKRVESGTWPDGKAMTDAEKSQSQDRLTMIRHVIEQLKQFTYQQPTLLFEHELRIDLGDRSVQLMYLGRGNTAGDAIAYLPKERMVVTGDLLDHPVPYAFGGYPSEWIETLERLSELDAATIVPGHGDVQHDKKYLLQVIELMKYVVAFVSDQLIRNPDVKLDDVKKALDISSFRQKILGDDAASGNFFANSIGNSFVEIAYYEAKQR